jgi:hypothetical protein
VNVKQFGAILPAVVPPPGTGKIMLSNGRELIGTWGWNLNLMLAQFTETDGTQWIIDVNAVIAFSPITASPTLTATPTSGVG